MFLIKQQTVSDTHILTAKITHHVLQSTTTLDEAHRSLTGRPSCSVADLLAGQKIKIVYPKSTADHGAQANVAIVALVVRVSLYTVVRAVIAAFSPGIPRRDDRQCVNTCRKTPPTQLLLHPTLK